MARVDSSLLTPLREALGGRVYTDVPLCSPAGGWPSGTADHRIDAVVVPGHPEPAIAGWADDPEGFDRAVAGVEVYLAVARGYIDRPLLGLLVTATDLFSRSHPDHGLLRQVAVAERVEPNAAWLYHRRGIRIIRA